MIISVPAVMTRHELDQMHDHLNQGSWQSGDLTAGEQAKQVKHNEQLDPNSKLAQQLGDFVLDKLAQHPLFLSAALPLKIYPPLFNRYQDNGTYGFHVDNAVRFISGSATRVRSDLSATLFLSEPDEYEGGELIIQDQFGEHKVKLAAGDMILYPSSSLHKVTPVTQGQRTSVVLWLQSMVKENSHRDMLFNLDQSIQNLTKEHNADHPEVIKLSQLYQNLIRQWADC